MSEGLDYLYVFCHRQDNGEKLNSSSHHALQMALDDKLFLAPLNNPQKVLDVGAGTGMWTMCVSIPPPHTVQPLD